MDSYNLKQKVPRLSFPVSNFQEEEITSTRSDVDDWIFPTSFRNTNEKTQENLENQIDRLNQILENVINTINPLSENSLNISKIEENPDFSKISKNADFSESSILQSYQEKDDLICFITRLQMKIQDFESRNAEKQEKTKNSSMKPEEIKIKIQKYLKKYLEFNKPGRIDFFLNSSIFIKFQLFFSNFSLIHKLIHNIFQ